MATVKYEDLLPDIIPMVPGCTDTLIENTIRNTVIELCEKSEVYQAELDPVDTVANTYEYDFEPPTGTVSIRYCGLLMTVMISKPYLLLC